MFLGCVCLSGCLWLHRAAEAAPCGRWVHRLGWADRCTFMPEGLICDRPSSAARAQEAWETAKGGAGWGHTQGQGSCRDQR